MSFTYELESVASECLHWIRWRTGTTKEDRPLAEDEEIAAALTRYGLAVDDDPYADGNERPANLAAQMVVNGIIAGLSRDSEVVSSEIGPVKSSAADTYRKLLKELKSEVTQTGSIKFANPESYATTHVQGVDPDPDEE